MISLFILLGIGLVSIVLPPIYAHIGQPLHEQIAPGYVLTLTPEQYHGYEMIWPVLAVVTLVLTCCFIGDGLEAAFDPHDQDYGIAGSAAAPSSSAGSSSSFALETKGRGA